MSTTETHKELTGRVVGCILGQTVGDALGSRYEFQELDAVQRALRTDLDTKGHLPMLGGGICKLVPGAVTDDSEMALTLARCLIRCGAFDVQEVAKAYSRWYHSSPPDIGATTMSALKHTRPEMTSQQVYETMMHHSKQDNANSLSNGCLMRISTLALAGCSWPLESLQRAARADCCLTNPHVVAQDAVVVYITAIRTALLTGSRSAAYHAALTAAQTPVIQAILDQAQHRPHPVPLHTYAAKSATTVMTDNEARKGYLGIALQNAFYELVHAKTFESALLNIISRGGDTDTNAAIAGALLGTTFGFSAIPIDWSTCVLNVKGNKRNKQYPESATHDLIEVAFRLLSCKA